jgi:hypothetical protein
MRSSNDRGGLPFSAGLMGTEAVSPTMKVTAVTIGTRDALVKHLLD